MLVTTDSYSIIFSGMQDVVGEERPESASLRLRLASKSLNGECPDKSMSMGFLVQKLPLHSRRVGSTWFNPFTCQNIVLR